jgi:hypothetical protein
MSNKRKLTVSIVKDAYSNNPGLSDAKIAEILDSSLAILYKYKKEAGIKRERTLPSMKNDRPEIVAVIDEMKNCYITKICRCLEEKFSIKMQTTQLRIIAERHDIELRPKGEGMRNNLIKGRLKYNTKEIVEIIKTHSKENICDIKKIVINEVPMAKKISSSSIRKVAEANDIQINEKRLGSIMGRKKQKTIDSQSKKMPSPDIMAIAMGRWG